MTKEAVPNLKPIDNLDRIIWVMRGAFVGWPTGLLGTSIWALCSGREVPSFCIGVLLCWAIGLLSLVGPEEPRAPDTPTSWYYYLNSVQGPAPYSG